MTEGGVTAFPITPPSLGQGFRERPVNFVITTSDSYQNLSQMVRAFQDEMAKNPGLVQVDTDLGGNAGLALTDRPLQGQSPYDLNAGAFYQDDDNHWQVSAQYNVIGPRISFVGDKGNNPSIIELPRHVVDLAVTKGIGTHFEVRAGVQNLLDQLVRQNYDFDRNGKINGIENEASFNRYRRGTYSTLGLTYRF